VNIEKIKYTYSKITLLYTGCTVGWVLVPYMGQISALLWQWSC